jgi:hypothetical protein
MNKQEQADSFKVIAAEVRSRLLKEWDRLTGNIAETMVSKGQDYAGEEDRLRNFKVAGAISGISPKQQCLSLIATKVARLSTLYTSGRKPNNEPTLDSEYDLIVYGFLQSMLTMEAIEEERVEDDKFPFVKRGDCYVAHKDSIAELQLGDDVVIHNGHIFEKKPYNRVGVNQAEPVWVEYDYCGKVIKPVEAPPVQLEGKVHQDPSGTKTVHYIQRTPPWKGVGPGI